MTATIGILSPQVESHYYALIIEGVHEVVTARGGRVLAQDTLLPGNRRLPLAQCPLGPGSVDGLIVILDALDDAELRALVRRQFPVVAISRPIPDGDAPYVIADNAGGMRLGVAHLIEHGHQAIAYLGGPHANEDARQRYNTYHAVLREAGRAPDAAREVFGDWSEESGERAMHELLDRGGAFSALVAANDLMAFGAMRAVNARGRRVPNDVAVVGFDDAILARYQRPPLTTVRQPMYTLGTSAASLLLNWLAGRTPAPGAHAIETALIVRQSCGCQPPWATRVTPLTSAEED